MAARSCWAGPYSHLELALCGYEEKLSIVKVSKNNHLPDLSSLLRPIVSSLLFAFCTAYWSLPSAITRWPAYVFSTSPPHSTQSITIDLLLNWLSSWFGVSGTD